MFPLLFSPLLINDSLQYQEDAIIKDESEKYHLQVNFIKICQTNKVLVTASRDGSFCIWDIVQVSKKYIGGSIPKVWTPNVQTPNVCQSICTLHAGVGERSKAVGAVQLRSRNSHHKVGAGGKKWSHIIY